MLSMIIGWVRRIRIWGGSKSFRFLPGRLTCMIKNWNTSLLENFTLILLRLHLFVHTGPQFKSLPCYTMYRQIEYSLYSIVVFTSKCLLAFYFRNMYTPVNISTLNTFDPIFRCWVEQADPSMTRRERESSSLTTVSYSSTCLWWTNSCRSSRSLLGSWPITSMLKSCWVLCRMPGRRSIG